MSPFNLSLLILLGGAFPALADWPSRVFAPYIFLGAGDGFKLTDCDDACGLKYYTMAFIIARQEVPAKMPSITKSLPGMAASPWTRTFTKTKLRPFENAAAR